MLFDFLRKSEKNFEFIAKRKKLPIYVLFFFSQRFIMVPYYPWKLSHKHHHKNTGNIDKEEIFYPIREKNCEVENKNIDDHRHKLLPLFGLGFGWFYYLIKGYPPRYISHINPWGNSIFVKNTMACLLSIICCGTMLMTMLAVYANFGLTFGQFTIHYIVPLFVFATWLVVTTFLHHQVCYVIKSLKIGR